MFRMRSDTDFDGLRQASAIAENHPDPLSTGRNLRINEVLGEGIEEADDFFDQDLGESSEDEE